MADAIPALRTSAEQLKVQLTDSADLLRSIPQSAAIDSNAWWTHADTIHVAVNRLCAADELISDLLAALTLAEQEREKTKTIMESCEPPKSLREATEARDQRSAPYDPMNDQSTAHDLLDRYRTQFASEDQFEHMCATVNLALCRQTECGQMVPTGTGSTVCKRPNGHAGVCSSSEARLAVVEPQGSEYARRAFHAGYAIGGEDSCRRPVVYEPEQEWLKWQHWQRQKAAPPLARGSDTPEKG